jgi:hypothetical protein
LTMKKQIYIFPVAVSGFLSGRLADYIVEYLMPIHTNSYFQLIEVFLGIILSVIGIIMGCRTIKLFFDKNGLIKPMTYLLLMVYVAIAGIGVTWATDGFLKLVLVKYLL